MSLATHTCEKSGRSNCAPCMKIEVDLWAAIDRYATSVRGDPSKFVYGNGARMQAVADVDAVVRSIIDEAVARKRIDDVVVEDLARSSNAAAAAACARGEEIHRLRDALRGILVRLARIGERTTLKDIEGDLKDIAAIVDRALDQKEDP